ncbi:MAG: membrane-bound lytic murein transglycosylase MltF [Pseudomonadota bacterium]|nr:membrane-bound lytic murein transglycosylase MltF [Pseudomonadota bacterium]
MKKAITILLAVLMSTCSKPPTALDEILASGVLRVITKSGPTTYYRGTKEFEGPEYLLLRGFRNFLNAKYNRNLKLEITTIDQLSAILPAVESENFHIAAAGLSITEKNQQMVAFGPTYQTVKQSLIYRLGTGKPRNLSHLDGKKLEVMAGASYIDTLKNKQLKHPDLIWSENPNAEVSELLMAVESQDIDYTIADTTSFQIYRQYMPDLRVAMHLKESDQIAWAFNLNNSSSLRVEASKYFNTIKENGMLEQILDRYYGHTTTFDYVGARTFIRHFDSRLSSYRSLFEKAAKENSIDWRLLASISYQESHWDPSAVSRTGVKGMMMLTKVTADSLGIKNRVDPKQSIPAAAKYFSMLHQRLLDIPEPDRTWFAMAAYNIGFGHLQDARHIVRLNGGNPNRWLDVEEALPLLAQREWFSKVKYGYARGWETVKYVSNVRNYLGTLNWLTANKQPNKNRATPIKHNLNTELNKKSTVLTF